MENNVTIPAPASQPTSNPQGIFAPILVATVITFIVLTLFAGLPPEESRAGFLLGIGVLILFTSCLGVASWHLMLRPLPANVRVTPVSLVSPFTRSIIALFLTLSTISVGVGGVWDEIWHTKYGIPFGEDFFWRPHIMLYFSFLSMIVLGGWSWLTLMQRGKGTLQQRFRASPLLGVSFLAGVFTIYAVGTDPLWHKLYGRDLAPWSVPHLLILILILLMGLTATAYHKTLMSPRTWKLGFNASWRDALIGLAWVGALVDLMLIFTIQWYAAAANPNSSQFSQVMGYPDWLFSIFTTFLAVLFGGLALHTTRQIGIATLVGVVALAARFGLDNGFGAVRPGTLPLGLIIPMMFTLDVMYAIFIQRTGKPPAIWMTAAVIGVVFGVVGYPLIANLFPFLPVTVANVPARIIASGLTAAATLWLAQTISEMISYGQEVTAEETAKNVVSVPWLNTAIYVAFTVLLVFFITTASPPV